MSPLRTSLLVAGMLLVSNLFMTYAWYGHIRDLRDRPLWIAVLVSWGVAFAEYWLLIPANRMGAEVMNLGQLKILQEVISLSIFPFFAVLYMGEKFRWDWVWAFLCLLGAAYFLFRRQAA